MMVNPSLMSRGMLLRDTGNSARREPRPTGYRAASEPLSRREVFARRNDLWLSTLKRGLPDAGGGLLRCDVRTITV
jgi:hypothetical protein